jgi:hypothetical protein
MIKRVSIHQSCQQQIVYTFGNNGLQLYNLITIGAVEMISPFVMTVLPAILSGDNMDATTQSWWSVIGVYLNEYVKAEAVFIRIVSLFLGASDNKDEI